MQAIESIPKFERKNRNPNEQMLLSAEDLSIATGLDKGKCYELLRRKDMPVVLYGRRRYMLRHKFLEKLEELAEQGKALL